VCGRTQQMEDEDEDALIALISLMDEEKVGST
jgi:hypothetical protein